MEKDILSPQEHEQIARYLAGEMEQEELRVLMEDIQMKPEKQAAFDELCEAWQLMEVSMPEVDAGAAWSKLSQRIDEQEGMMEAATTVRLRSMPAYLKWAAGWLLLIALGAMTYFSFFRTEAPQAMLTLLTANEDLTHVHTLEDGTIIYLGNQTAFSFPGAFQANERNVELKGEAFFDVAHRPHQPFVIHTPTARIEVLGTSFNLKTFADKQLELFVETGRVRVTLLKGDAQPFLVEPGELLIAKENEAVKTQLTSAYNTAWRKNHMHFKDQPLESILQVLSNNFEASFNIEDTALRQRKLTLTFYNNSTDTMAQLIALSLNIDFEKGLDGNYVFKSKN